MKCRFCFVEVIDLGAGEYARAEDTKMICIMSPSGLHELLEEPFDWDKLDRQQEEDKA